MSHQFKPGDLALIKQCKTWPPAVGRCVTLLHFIPAGASDFFAGRIFNNIGDGDGWVIASPEGFPVNSFLFGLRTDALEPTALFQQRLLMPLKGDKQPAQVRQAERVQ